MENNLNTIILTDDPLKNIFIMAPLLDEAGQNRVFGLMCGWLTRSTMKSGTVVEHKNDSEPAVEKFNQ